MSHKYETDYEVELRKITKVHEKVLEERTKKHELELRYVSEKIQLL